MPRPSTTSAERLVQLPIVALRLMSFAFLMIFMMLSRWSSSSKQQLGMYRGQHFRVYILLLFVVSIYPAKPAGLLNHRHSLFLQTLFDCRFHCIKYFGFCGALGNAYRTLDRLRI